MRVLSEDEVRALTDREVALAAVEEADRQFGLMPDIQSRPPVLFIGGLHWTSPSSVSSLSKEQAYPTRWLLESSSTTATASAFFTKYL